MLLIQPRMRSAFFATALSCRLIQFVSHYDLGPLLLYCYSSSYSSICICLLLVFSTVIIIHGTCLYRIPSSWFKSLTQKQNGHKFWYFSPKYIQSFSACHPKTVCLPVSFIQFINKKIDQRWGQGKSQGHLKQNVWSNKMLIKQKVWQKNGWKPLPKCHFSASHRSTHTDFIFLLCVFGISRLIKSEYITFVSSPCAKKDHLPEEETK